MKVEFAKGLAAVEVFALRDVCNRLWLSDSEAEFRRLMLDGVTRIVEEQLSCGSPPGGRYVDGEDDEDGDGSRLHFWLERSGATLRMVILQFDEDARTPPIVTDGMAILHGERLPICRFIVYQEASQGGVRVEYVPSGALSDEKRAPPKPQRPAAAAKPLIHRIARELETLWQSTIGGLGAWRRACNDAGAQDPSIGMLLVSDLSACREGGEADEGHLDKMTVSRRVSVQPPVLLGGTQA